MIAYSAFERSILQGYKKVWCVFAYVGEDDVVLKRS